MNLRYRTPTSLNWLINQKAKFLGDIARLEQTMPARLVETEKAVQQARINLELAKQRHKTSLFIQKQIIADIQKKVMAVDLMLSLHEVKINPNLVCPVKKHLSKRVVNYGEITKGIFECLRIHQTRLKTSSISDYVFERYYEGPKDEIDKYEFQIIIRKRLRFLAAKGEIHRFHTLRTCVEGEWGLSKRISKTTL